MKTVQTGLLLMLGLCTTLCAVAADDKRGTPFAFTVGEERGKFSAVAEDVPLDDVVREATKLANLNIVADPALMRTRVSFRFKNVEVLPMLRSLVQAQGYVLDEQPPRSGVYVIRARTDDERRAESLRRFFDALRKEGFSEDQAMRVLLRTLGGDEED